MCYMLSVVISVMILSTEIVTVMTANTYTMCQAIRRRDVEKVKSIMNNYTRLANFYEEPIHCAADERNVEITRLLLENGADVNAKDYEGKTPLFYAVDKYEASRELIQLLLQYGADVNVVEKGNRKTVLFYAVQYVWKMQLLVEHGVNVNAADEWGRTALFYSLYMSLEKSIRFLLEHEAELNIGDQRKFNLKYQHKAEQTNSLKGGCRGHGLKVRGDTPLHRAVEGGSVEVSKILLENGANVNAPNKFKETPFMVAVSKPTVELPQLLIDYGANVNDASWIWALRESNMTILRLLVENGANVNPEVESIRQPICAAMSDKNREHSIPFLIQHGARLDTINQAYMDGTGGLEDGVWKEGYRSCMHSQDENLLKYFLKEGVPVPLIENSTDLERSYLPSIFMFVKKPDVDLLKVVVYNMHVTVVEEFFKKIRLSEKLSPEIIEEIRSVKHGTISLKMIYRTVMRAVIFEAYGYRSVIPGINKLNIPTEWKQFLNFSELIVHDLSKKNQG